MALISPILDDRSYPQLRDELIQRIPVYTKEWTDYNETDPGIALLDLFAYLGESVLYRFNQIPETTKIEFLRLLGVQPRSARPARAIVAATTEVAAGVAVPRGAAMAAGRVPFRADAEMYAWPLDCVAAAKRPAPKIEEPVLSDVRGNARYRIEQARRADARARAGLLANQASTFYVTEQLPADPNSPDATPLEIGATVDRRLWVAVLRKKTTDLTALGGRSLFLGIGFDEALGRPFDLQKIPPPRTAEDFAGTAPGREPADGRLTAPAPAVLWELWAGPGKDRIPLTPGSDTTGGLVTSGVVELPLPARLPRLAPGDVGSGDQNSPPPLDDEEQAANVVAWIVASRPPDVHLNDTIGRVRWVGLNAVPVIQSRVATPELLGTGTGDADQRYPLAQVAGAPAGTTVLPGSTVLQVEEPDGWQPWQEVDTFIVSGAEDRHYTVDYTGGAVEFGGPRVPQLGERIRTVSYEYCMGTAGNFPPGSITAVPAVGGIKVTNPLRATGGMDAATLADALDAIPAAIHRRDRAVTATDFGELAREVTGVARAEPLPLTHPDTPAVTAAGVVSVVIFPAEDLTTPDAPLPGMGLLRRVAQYLDERRLVTTELYVIPPTYREVAVAVGLAVRRGYQVDAVRRWAGQLLRQYLAPLPPHGPDGGGWPLGRTVRRAELEAVVVQVEGVEYATGLRLGRPDGAGGYADVAELVLQRWEVPHLVAVTVVDGKPLAPGEAYAPPDPGTLVPLPPDIC